MSGMSLLAELHYDASDFDVIRPGTHVVCAVSGEPIEVRCLAEQIAITPQRVAPELVGHEENDVWLSNCHHFVPRTQRSAWNHNRVRRTRFSVMMTMRPTTLRPSGSDVFEGHRSDRPLNGSVPGHLYVSCRLGGTLVSDARSA